MDMTNFVSLESSLLSFLSVSQVEQIIRRVARVNELSHPAEKEVTHPGP